MKTIRKPLLLGALLATICLTTMGQGIVQNIITTAYTRIFLRATTAAQARAILGVGGSIETNLTGVAIGDGAGAITGWVGTAGYLPTWSATTPYLSATSPLFSTGTRIILGHTANISVGGASNPFQIHATGASGINAARFSNNSNGPTWESGKSRGTTIGDYTAVQSGDALGQFRFSGADGTDLDTLAARIMASVDNTVAANQVPGSLKFDTSSSAGTLTERLLVNSEGVFIFGSNNTEPTAGVADKTLFYNRDVLGIAGNSGGNIMTETGNKYSFGTNAIFAGGIAFPYLTIQTNAAANAVVANRTRVKVYGSGGGAVTITATPTIANGTPGQYLIVQGTDNTATITLQDETSLAGSNLELAGGTSVVLGALDNIVLCYDSDAAVWFEISRNTTN